MIRALATGFTLLAAAFVAPAGAQSTDECAHEAPRNATLEASGIDRLQIDARAGSLVVAGRNDLAEIRVRGRACADEAAALQAIRLVDTRLGTTIRLEALTPEDWRGGEGYARLDVVIEVPLGLTTEIRDTSGAIELRGLGDVTVADGSGALRAEDIAGGIRVEDGSGAITLHRVGGDVTVEDGSGEINVTGVAGAVEVSDGSGMISVQDVTGSVVVRRDGSGMIRVVNVGGDFIVEHDGTGTVSHDNVAGTVRNEAAGF